MANTVVTNTLQSVDFAQLAPAQAGKTSWEPGKASSYSANAGNDRPDTPVVVGIPAIDALGIQYVRTANVSMGVVNDTVKPTPVVSEVVSETVTDPASISGSHTTTFHTIIPVTANESSPAGTEVV